MLLVHIVFSASHTLLDNMEKPLMYLHLQVTIGEADNHELMVPLTKLVCQCISVDFSASRVLTLYFIIMPFDASEVSILRYIGK